MVCKNVKVWGMLVWSQLSYKLIMLVYISRGGKGRSEVKWLVLNYTVLALAFPYVWFPSPTLPSSNLNPMLTPNICWGVQEDLMAVLVGPRQMAGAQTGLKLLGQSQVAWLFCSVPFPNFFSFPSLFPEPLPQLDARFFSNSPSLGSS